MKTIQNYSAVFGRNPAIIKEETDDYFVATAFFPAFKPNFFKSLMCEGHDQFIYITSGLSKYPMPAPRDLPYKPETKIELIAVCEGQITGGENGQEDIPSIYLQIIAQYIIENKIFIEPGHTLNFEEPLCSNTQMSAILFALPEGIDTKRVCKAARPAQSIITLVPITENELKLAKEKGVVELITAFENNEIQPLFDPFRSSVV